MYRVAVVLWIGVIFTSVFSCAAEPQGEQASPAKPAAKNQGGQTLLSAKKGDKRMTIEITSSAFKEGERIPKKYTGEGTDVSPPLTWTSVPDGVKELVLICDDPDAPTDDPWVHWIIYKIPPDVKNLKEGVPRKPRLTDPPGALQGQNSWPKGQNIGYRGPMPPPGHGVHRYYFKLYALEAKMAVESGLDKKAILQEIEHHVLAKGQLMGTYQR
jgi:Raf kinase inhibitor-like YbhB/YbcL family protein